MPNWIEGNMKVRGAEKDVYRFFSEMFAYYTPKIERKNGEPIFLNVKNETKVKIDIDEDGYGEIEISKGCYFEGSRRAFTTETSYIYFENVNSEKQITECIGFKQAWGWSEENYVEPSKKYNVDIKLIGWERGMQYKAEVEVIRGKEPVYKETTYYDYTWETECPTMGG